MFLLNTTICHCTQCQKMTGAGHAPQIAVAWESFRIEGKLSYVKQPAEAGYTVSNGFCHNCGNPILKKTTTYPEAVYIHIGCLDDPGQFEPEFVVFSSSGHAWDLIDPGVKRI